MIILSTCDEDSNHHASIDESMESEDGELYRLELRNGKKVFTKSRYEPSKGKGGGKGKIDRECYRCGRTGHIRADWRAKTHINGGPRNPHPKEKVLEVARKKNQKHRKMCHWGPLIWGLLRCCQTTVTQQKMTSTLTNVHKKLQKLCHLCRLLLGSGRQGLHIIQRCIAGNFGNLAMETVETKSLHFLIVGILTFCSTRILGHETHRSLYPM